MADLPKLRPLQVKDRTPIVHLEKGELDVINGSFVLVDRRGIRIQIPIGSIACLILEPGVRITHAAVVLASRVRCLLIWTGEGGVRLYASGQPGGARADRLLYQARIAVNDAQRLRVVRKMYAMRFGCPAPTRRSIEQLRGLEGARTRKMYTSIALRYGITWTGRCYDRSDWAKADLPNRCLSAATSCLYSVTHAAVLAAGYSPAIGFIHSGKPLSFVYDIADLFKFEVAVPAAFEVAAGRVTHPERQVRQLSRDLFRRTRLLERIIPTIDETLAASGETPPVEERDDSVGPLFEAQS